MIQVLLPTCIPVYVYLFCTSLRPLTHASLQFLQRHRVEPSKLMVPTLEQVLSYFSQREKLVDGRYHMLLEKDKGEGAV